MASILCFLLGYSLCLCHCYYFPTMMASKGGKDVLSEISDSEISDNNTRSQWQRLLSFCGDKEDN